MSLKNKKQNVARNSDKARIAKRVDREIGKIRNAFEDLQAKFEDAISKLQDDLQDASDQIESMLDDSLQDMENALDDTGELVDELYDRD